MNMIPLLKRALGDEWDKLPPVIQRHYQLSEGGSRCYVVRGAMQVGYPAFVKPILIGYSDAKISYTRYQLRARRSF